MKEFKYPKYLRMGMRFGRLTVIGVDPDSIYTDMGKKNRPSLFKYLCECSCKEHSIVSIAKSSLVRNCTHSCGCIYKETSKINGENNKKYNPIEDCGDYIKIFFFNKESQYTIIDKEDYDKIKDYCWHIKRDSSSNETNKRLYACSYHHGKYYSLHSLILPVQEGFIVDHKDGNGLNNRKSNLRRATYSQNNMNTSLYKNNKSGYKGIYWNKKNKNWRVKIQLNNKMIEIGSFKDLDKAIEARIKAEEEYFGEFSVLNRQKEDYNGVSSSIR